MLKLLEGLEPSWLLKFTLMLSKTTKFWLALGSECSFSSVFSSIPISIMHIYSPNVCIFEYFNGKQKNGSTLIRQQNNNGVTLYGKHVPTDMPNADCCK